jgi:DNA-binding LacI/PurR family transcriptional regulator
MRGTGLRAAHRRPIAVRAPKEAGDMSASIEDVASLAGVSIATVSRSLRGLPDVAPSTRERVLAAARSLDYVASPFAARLASGRSATIGAIVPFVNRWFFGEVIAGAEGVLREADYDLLLYNLDDTAGRDRFFSQMPVRKRVDGVLVLSMLLTDAELDALRSLRVPIALVGNGAPGVFSVRIDDTAGAQRAVAHLVKRGHTRIGIIGGRLDDPMRFTTAGDRHLGYQRALAEAGLPQDPTLEAVGYFTIDGGEEAMGALLGLSERPTAVFAESDEMAYGAMRAIRRAGLRIPDDIAVVGFDDHAMADLLDLSTVRQPVQEQGAKAARALLDALADASLQPGELVLPTDLVVRGSTDPAARAY